MSTTIRAPPPGPQRWLRNGLHSGFTAARCLFSIVVFNFSALTDKLSMKACAQTGGSLRLLFSDDAIGESAHCNAIQTIP